MRSIVLTALFSAASVCSAQMHGSMRPHDDLQPWGTTQPRETSVLGQVQADGSVGLAGLSVELISQQVDAAPGRAEVMPSGDFELQGVPFGSYELRVLDGRGEVIHRQFVTIGNEGTVLVVRLPCQARSGQPGSGTVSVAQLHRKVPSKAVKEAAKASKAEQAGKMEESIKHLKKAIETDPTYVDAYNNLGVIYMRLHETGLAVAQFQKATELDNQAAPAFSNLGLALLSQHRLPEAEKAAREAVKLNGTDHKSRMVLGLVLLNENHCDEALPNLRIAETDFPKLRLASAGILSRKGQKDQAVIELEKYLKLGKPENRNEVETWIAELRVHQ